MDLIYDAFGVNAIFKTLPVDGCLLLVLLLDIVEVKDGCKLAVSFT